ncbi:MAG: NYN domain-containing protein [Chlamydiae bacterium]|nr:NYN domain-containing protein [Chlamydiota bacterium]
MHYFIDGYNLLFRLSQEKMSFERSRQEVIASLLGVKLSLTVVFDGGGGDGAQRTHKGPLEIIYTAKGQSADSYILDELAWIKKPGAYTVVTSDKPLGANCRQLGASVKSISDFLEALYKKQAIKRVEKPIKDNEKELSRLLKIFQK